MNRRELVAAIAAHTEQDAKVVDQTLRGLVDVVSATIKKGEPVVMSGFTKWNKVKRPARMARNPQTGEPVKVKASQRVRITPLKALKDVASGAAPAPKVAKAPAKKAASTRTSTTAARSAAPQAAATKATAKKATAKKATAKKATAKKAATKATAKKATTKAAATKAPARKATTKATAKKAPAKKATATKAPAKRTAKKATGRS